MIRANNSSNHCSSKKNTICKKESLPFLAVVFIALIPKCPFCILAYSSAITLCSGTKVYMHSPAWTSWISIALAAMTLLMILLNYRGQRTIIAASLVIIGSAMIMISELYTGEISIYYCGASILLFGVWFNASFYFFYRKWILPMLKYGNHPFKTWVE